MIPRKKIRIGDLLVEHKVVSEAQLQNALVEQRKTGHKLGRTLVALATSAKTSCWTSSPTSCNCRSSTSSTTSTTRRR